MRGVSGMNFCETSGSSTNVSDSRDQRQCPLFSVSPLDEGMTSLVRLSASWPHFGASAFSL